MRIRDIMTRKVITLSPDTLIVDVEAVVAELREAGCDVSRAAMSVRKES